MRGRMFHVRGQLIGAAIVLLLGGGVSAQQQTTFQARTDVIPVDVSVVDGRGQPLRDLTAADFTVRIDGQPRRILSAEWIPLATKETPRTERRVPDGYASNEQTAGGRLVVLAIDQPSIPFNAMRPVHDALFRFIDGLESTDMLALIGFGQAAPSVPFTADRERIKQALARVAGQDAADTGRHSVGLSAA